MASSLSSGEEGGTAGLGLSEFPEAPIVDPKNSVLGLIIRTYKKVGFGRLRLGCDSRTGYPI